MPNFDWMRRLCALDPRRAAIAVPRLVTLDGRLHTIATNGHACLAVPGIHAGATEFEGDDSISRRKFETQVAGIYELRGLPRVLSLPALCEFVRVDGPVPVPCPACADARVVACDECAGRGVVRYAGEPSLEECDGCNGDGDAECDLCMGASYPAVVVKLGRLYYNRTVIARAVRNLEGERVEFRQRPEGAPALLIGDGWRLALMSMRASAIHESGRHQGAPEFDGWLEAVRS